MINRRLSATEELFRLVSENVTDFSIVMLDPEGNIISWTEGAQIIEGYTAQEIIGQHFSVFMTREDIDAGLADECMRKAVDEGHVEMEGWRLRKNGERFWANVVITAARNEDGAVTGFVRITRDITERQRAAEALERSERYFRALIENAVEVITILNADGSVRYSSPAIERLIGFAPEERRGKSVFDLIHPDDVAKGRAVFQRLWKQPEVTAEALMRVSHRDGSWRHVEFRARNLLADPAVSGIVVNWHDVTEQLQAEERLKAREHFFRSIIERSSDILVVVDETRTVRYVSPAFETLLGYPPEEILDKSGFHLVHPDDVPLLEKLLESVYEKHSRNADIILRARRANGEYRVLDVRVRNLLDDPLFEGVVVDARDITESQRIQQALTESEERFRTIIETAGEGIGIRDPDGRLVFVNQRLADVVGYTVDEMLGRDIYELVAPEYRKPMEESSERRKQTRMGEQLDVEMLHKDGSRRSVILSASPFFDSGGNYIGSLGMVTDITERKALEEQLRQSQKIEAVGRLAGGIAHDFNNLLTAIRGHVDLLLHDIAEDAPMRGDIMEIRKASDRAAALTHQLLAFSRQQILQPRVIEIDQIVGDMDTLLRRLIGEDIRLITKLRSNRASVRADRGQIEQVLMNLAVNSRDAMPRGGTLTIDTAAVELSREFVRENSGAQPGPHLRLRVLDSGVGMDAQTLSHVFEPFFTTKEVGKGTGLGLATVYGIVKQSGGYIRVQSQLGKGTSFEIFLPLVEEVAETPSEPIATSSVDAKGETILVAEDEEAVRSLTVRILRKRGYAVLEARNGTEALQVAQAHDGTIDLLLTDVVMPVLGGRELAERLTEVRPDIKVLFMSGYTDDALLQRGVLLGEGNFLEKPFTPSGLAEKVRHVLNNHGAEAHRRGGTPRSETGSSSRPQR